MIDEYDEESRGDAVAPRFPGARACGTPRGMMRVPLSSPAAVTSLAWHPDSAAFVLGLADGGVAHWSVDARQERDRLAAHAAPVTAVALAGDGKHLATGGADGQVCVWDLRPVVDGLLSRATCVATHRLARAVRALAWSPAGRLLAAADERGAVLGLDVADLAVPRFSQAHPAADCEQLLWQDEHALWGGGHGLVLLWADDLALDRRVIATDGRVLALAYSREERCMLVALATGVVHDNPDERERVFADAGERVQCWASACARVHTLMACGTREGAVRVYLHERGDAAARECGSFSAHRGPVTALACAPSGFGLLSVGDDGDATLWLQGEAASLDAPAKKSYERWCSAARSDAGAIALTGGLGIGVLGRSLHITVADDPNWGGYGGLAWSPGGDALIAVDDERADLRRYDLTGAQLARRPHARGFAGGLAVARDGLVAVSTRGGGLTIVDPDFADVAEVATTSDVASLAWSSDGQLAALDEARELTVFADRGTRPIVALTTAAWSGQRHSLAWAPDGQHLAVGGDALLLVDAAAGAVVRRHGCALSPAFSPDGRWLAAHTPPQTVVVRDWRDDRPVAFWQRTIAPSAGTEPLLLAWRDDRTLLLITEHSVTAWTIAPLGPA